MSPRLAPGLTGVLRFAVPVSKTVPVLYPESQEFGQMPAVFSTGFLVGLLEWACMRLVHPLLPAGQHTVGTHVDVSHGAPTPPGR